MIANIPKFFIFRTSRDLIRIGKDNDGGYLLSSEDLKRSQALISMGLSDDWSFEKNFLSINEVDLYAYDGSINNYFWIKIFIKDFIKNPLLINKFFKSFLFKFFFRGNRRFIKKFIGNKTFSKNYYSFSDAINDIKNKLFFLKIDIEGSEYRILDDIVRHQNKITGLVIEFHSCDVNLDKIEKFINNFALKLIHIHANNACQVRYDDRLPYVLELTFSSFAKDFIKPNFPHSLDMPNNPKNNEIILQFNEK